MLHTDGSPSLEPPTPPIIGFDTGGHQRPPATFAGKCVDCGNPHVTAGTFVGESLCTRCDLRRSMCAELLAAIVRGATPEELASFTVASSDARAEALERQELRDHIDVLFATLGRVRTEESVETKAVNKSQAARLLGVSVDFFDAHIAHELHCVRRSRRCLYPTKELDRWLDSAAERVT